MLLKYLVMFVFKLVLVVALWSYVPYPIAMFDSLDVALFSVCTSQQFRCHGGGCIPKVAECDGVAHCYDLSDEDHCG